MPVMTSKHAAAALYDATATPLAFTASPGPMDLAFDEIEAGNVEAIPVYNNGTFLELVEGQQKSVGWSLTIYQDGKLIDAVTGKPLNLALKAGTFASGTTGDPGGSSGVWTVAKMVVTLTRGGVTSTVTVWNSRIKAAVSLHPEGNQIKLSGIAYGDGSNQPIVIT